MAAQKDGTWLKKKSRHRWHHSKGKFGQGSFSVSRLGLTDLGVLDALSMSREGPRVLPSLLRPVSCGMPNIPIKQVEDSPDRPRTPSLRMKKYHLRAACLLDSLPWSGSELPSQQ